MTSIKMLLSYNNNEKAGRIASQYCSPMQPKVVQLPVIPNELPKVLQSLSNEKFETHTKMLTLLGNKKPRSFFVNRKDRCGRRRRLLRSKSSDHGLIFADKELLFCRRQQRH